MANYLINQKSGGEYYFYKPYEGICVKKRNPSGTWQDHTQVIALGIEPFSVYQASDLSIHIVCVDAENKLVYATKRNNVWKKYTIARFTEGIFLSDIQLYSVRGRLNVLYSALYNGENLLIHCILGNHAKPSTISVLENSHFFIFDTRVYCTNSAGVLGFYDLNDEKPSFFNKVLENSHHASVWSYEGKEFLLFIRDSCLYINEKKILKDERIENPVFIAGADRIYVMWKSGNFIRYISSFNGGFTWSEPMRFINTGSSFKLYRFQSGNMARHYYGYENSNNLTILGMPDLFKKDATFDENDQLSKIKLQLDIKTKEAEQAKKEVERLNKLLSGLMP